MPSTNVTVIPASRLNPQLMDVSVGNAESPFVAVDNPNGDNIINVNNKVIVMIKETGTAALTVTFSAVSTYSGIDLPDEVVVLAADDLCIIGPWPNVDFGGGAQSNVIEIAYSTSTASILPLLVAQSDV